MKLFPILLAVVLIIAAGTATSALAVDKTFAAGANNHWNTLGNWIPSGVPVSDDNAIIPVGEECHITNGNAQADSIEVYGTLTVEGSRKLSLSGDADSSIDDDGKLALSGTLVIKSDLTISGDGGEIEMGSGSVIDDDNDNGAELTVEEECDQQMEPDCALVVHGMGYIRVKLVNNAFVVADTFTIPGGMPLYLCNESKSGSGLWVAEDTGRLEVDLDEGEDVSGSGTWRIISTGVNVPWITIKTCCDGLTGDVILINGIFRAEESFCTTGDLTWQSVAMSGGGYTIPKFEVVQGKSATFGGSYQDICP